MEGLIHRKETIMRKFLVAAGALAVIALPAAALAAPMLANCPLCP